MNLRWYATKYTNGLFKIYFKTRIYLISCTNMKNCFNVWTVTCIFYFQLLKLICNELTYSAFTLLTLSSRNYIIKILCIVNSPSLFQNINELQFMQFDRLYSLYNKVQTTLCVVITITWQNTYMLFNHMHIIYEFY